MARTQINVRLEQELIEALDKKRIELQPTLGSIPTRSDVMRYALEEYLDVKTAKGKKSPRS